MEQTSQPAAALTVGKRIFFDISSLRAYLGETTRYSGIQRVVACVISEIRKNLPNELLFISYYDKSERRYHAICLADIAFDLADSNAAFAFFYPHRRRTAGIAPLAKYSKSPIKLLYHRTRLDIAAARSDERAFRKYGMTPEAWRTERRGKPKVRASSRAAQHSDFFEVARPGDDLLLLDSSWTEEFEELFLRARSQDLNVYTLVHDLIPILLPETTHGTMPETFYRWLTSTMRYTTSYLANSEATKQDLQAFLRINDCDLNVTAIPLAQDQVQIGDDGADGVEPVAPEIIRNQYPVFGQAARLETTLRAITYRPYALVVGTIELRKNIWRVAMAWKTLLDAGHHDLPQLVFAGRLGWCRENFDALMQATGNLYGYAQIADGPSDEELAFLYRNCDFTLMPSLYEGWGLPVGEALSYGKTAIVSNVSSLPEVGGDLVLYCDPTSIGSIAEAVKKMVYTEQVRPELERRIAQTRLRGWGEVARDLADHILSQGAPVLDATSSHRGRTGGQHG